MEALQVITMNTNLLADRKVHQDREKRLQKQSEDANRQALSALQEARQLRELNINHTVMEKLTVDQLQGRESLADQDRMTQIIQQLNIDEAHYNRIMNNEDDAEEDVKLLQGEEEFIPVHHGVKSPAKIQPKYNVDSDPRTSHHQPQRSDLPPLIQLDDDLLHCHPSGQINLQIEEHQKRQRMQAQRSSLKQQIREGQVNVANMQKQHQVPH